MAILNQDLPRTAFGACGFKLTVFCETRFVSVGQKNMPCVVLPAYLRIIQHFLILVGECIM